MNFAETVTRERSFPLPSQLTSVNQSAVLGRPAKNTLSVGSNEKKMMIDRTVAAGRAMDDDVPSALMVPCFTLEQLLTLSCILKTKERQKRGDAHLWDTPTGAPRRTSDIGMDRPPRKGLRGPIPLLPSPKE